MKYAAVTINFKTHLNGEIECRRVLIRYGKFKDVDNIRTYYETALIDHDDYFTAPNRSHLYDFTDDTYSLVGTSKEAGDVVFLNEPRRYHAYIGGDAKNNPFAPLEFGAQDDATAKKIYGMISKR